MENCSVDGRLNLENFTECIFQTKEEKGYPTHYQPASLMVWQCIISAYRTGSLYI